MHHRPFQQGKGMRAAPPAGGIGGIAAMGRPGIGLILVQTVKPAHVLRVAHRLERAHVLAAGEHIGAFQLHVDLRHDPGHILLLVQLQPVQHRLHGRQKVAPDQRHIRDFRDLADGNMLRLDDLKALFQQRFAGLSGIPRVKEDVEGVKVPVLRVNAVPRKAAAQTVGTVMHGNHALHDLFSRHAAALTGDHGGNRASRRDADLPLFFHDVHPFKRKKASIP